MDESTTASVITKKYTRNAIKGIQDAQYREEILFEISNSDSDLSLSDLDLQKTKMLFGRFCYCPGQTGYYKVTAGKLTLKQKNKLTAFDLDFKVPQVPQIIKVVKATVTI